MYLQLQAMAQLLLWPWHLQGSGSLQCSAEGARDPDSSAALARESAEPAGLREDLCSRQGGGRLGGPGLLWLHFMGRDLTSRPQSRAGLGGQRLCCSGSCTRLPGTWQGGAGTAAGPPQSVLSAGTCVRVGACVRKSFADKYFGIKCSRHMMSLCHCENFTDPRAGLQAPHLGSL